MSLANLVRRQQMRQRPSMRAFTPAASGGEPMPVLRAYMMQSQGVLPGRGARRGDPFIGALAGLAIPALKKIGGKLLSKATGGRLIGQGGGKAALTRAAKAVGGFGVAVGGGVVGERISRRFGAAGGQRRYRRMNAGNAKALRRAFRRVEAFGKLAAKAGYVRKKTGRSCPPTRRKVC